MKIHGLKVLTAALIFYAAGANAQGVVTLICSGSPGGPPAFQLEINFDRLTVNWPAPDTSAQVSDQQIVWQRARYESGGTVIVAARFTLNRITGVLTGDNYCLARDSSWCNAASSLSYCKPGKKMF